MKIVISSGHGLHIRGARGNPVPPQCDEVDEARKIVNRVAEIWEEMGHSVEVFHDNTSYDQSDNLNTIVAAHNNAPPHDLDVSVHLNCYDHSAHGTEVEYLTQKELAQKVAQAIAEVGFTLRADSGANYRSDLKFLNATEAPAILIETFFCDNTGDCNTYNSRFEAVCTAIAEAVTGDEVVASPPDERPPGTRPPPPERPHWPSRPENVPLEDRPTLRKGDEGHHVLDMQRMIPRFSGEFDGDFGPMTYDNVVRYQRSRGLEDDGICGPQTWGSLYAHALPLPPPPPPPNALSPDEQRDIMEIANESEIADYSWDDRGVAPTGFTQGMALSFAQTLKKLWAEHPAAIEMAKARTGSDKDVFNVYRDAFNQLGMSNERPGVDTLRHLYSFMLGSGMRESSGQHCCGRDQSADNVESDTCEAGAFQTSYNASNASDPEFDDLMDEFIEGLHPGYLEAWSEGVSCSNADWESYGSGRGLEFQELCKNMPAFSAETHGLTLRNLCNHYGPVIRGEVELRREADEMFRSVQEYMEAGEMPA